MGISQLLPFLEKSTRPCHVSEFRGQTVAIDSYCWLHKGARSCAIQLAKGENTKAYLNYCLKYVNLLLSYNIKPIMVFDGRHLPAKVATEEKRRASKRHAYKQAMEFLRLEQMNDAYKYFCQCVEVTPEMALNLIQECRKIRVDCIVAPYESDAQLAFFNIRGVAECVISEDSDLLLFGSKKVLYKMDINGNGQLVESDRLHLSMNMRLEQYSFDKFRHMCILSGCDYLDSLPGIGLKKAWKFITMTVENDPLIFLDRVPRYLKIKNLKVPNDYKENFLVADASFKHQIVFDPFHKVLIPLNEVEMNNQYCKNSGSLFDVNEAYQLALGNLNPLTMEKVDNWSPESTMVSEFSIWSPRYKTRSNLSHQLEPLSTPRKTSKSALKKSNIVFGKVEKDLITHYKTDKINQTEETASIIASPETQDDKTSPVLISNPFIKKKISKFERTVTTSDCRIISRFFGGKESPKNSVLSSINNDTKNSMNVSSKLRNSFSEINLEVEHSIFSNSNRSDNQVDDVDHDNQSSQPTDVECECTLVVENQKLFIPEPEIGFENLPTESRGIKRKLRSENGRKPKKQMTIQDMIKNMNKK